MSEQQAGAPAWLLVGSGALTVIYSVLYLLWTLLGAVWPVIGSIQSVLEGSNSPGEAVVALLMLVAIPALQLVGFAATLLIGLVTAFGGFRLNSYRSRGLVWLAIVGSTAAPLLAAFVNAASMFNLGACGLGCITGCLLGNVPTIVLLAFGAVASGVAVFHLTRPGVSERFGA